MNLSFLGLIETFPKQIKMKLIKGKHQRADNEDQKN